MRVHFWHNQRNFWIIPPARRIIDHNGAQGTDFWRPDFWNFWSCRHQNKINFRKIKRFKVFALQGFFTKAHFQAHGTAWGDSKTLIHRKFAFSQNVQHFTPHIACGAYDGNFITHFATPKINTRQKWRASLLGLLTLELQQEKGVGRKARLGYATTSTKISNPFAERWQSGRSHRTRNAAYMQVYRGFESPPLRHSTNWGFSFKATTNWRCDCFSYDYLHGLSTTEIAGTTTIANKIT